VADGPAGCSGLSRPGRGSGIDGRGAGTVTQPVWLLCHPDLREFYQGNGFSAGPQLPYALAERLLRYSRSKPMIAMGRS